MDDAIRALKERQRASWNEGEYDWIGRALEPAAQHLVDLCAVSAGQEMLDVAAGDGNVALAAAREGASVVATDFSAAQVARGRTRTEAEGFDVEWLEADAEDLPFEDGRFDAVLSSFGAIFTPRPRHLAEELFRVVRPGGTVGLTAWNTGGFSGKLLLAATQLNPPPEGVEPSAEWAKEERIRERFDGLAGSIQIHPGKVLMHAESFEDAWSKMADSAGGLAAARRTLPPEQLEQMRKGIEALAREHQVEDEAGLAIENEYIAIVARKPG